MFVCADTVLYPFEEQLNCHLSQYNFGNNQCFMFKVVGEETVKYICAKVFSYTTSVRDWDTSGKLAGLSI